MTGFEGKTCKNSAKWRVKPFPARIFIDNRGNGLYHEKEPAGKKIFANSTALSTKRGRFCPYRSKRQEERQNKNNSVRYVPARSRISAVRIGNSLASVAKNILPPSNPETGRRLNTAKGRNIASGAVPSRILSDLYKEKI